MSPDDNNQAQSQADNIPQLDPLDEHVLSMLADEQWTTGAIRDSAEERLRNGDLEIDDIDVPDNIDEIEKEEDEEIQLVKPRFVYQSLDAFKRIGSIEYAHESTSLYRMVYDPRIVRNCQTQNETDADG